MSFSASGNRHLNLVYAQLRLTIEELQGSSWIWFKTVTKGVANVLKTGDRCEFVL
ncbi:MAG: hypothetical protein F6K11_25830 [Leptolyngbya sp. SIO3F4]|nr:hypothetical protein [Leptolyngbya sp. SIO3F4]